MSKGGRLSRLLPKLFRGGDSKAKTGSVPGDSKGPSCLVIFLDDSEQSLSYKGSWKGQALFDVVCDKLDLLERDYFGLRFVDDSGQAHWLDLNKSLSSQLKGCSVPHRFYFGVKFYAADPCKLREEITRYLFFLQVKRDILQGRLPVTFDEAAELCGYALQSELGDFDPRSCTPGYVSEFCFVPNQTEELEARIAGIHRRCLGASPVMAEQRFLEKVKWLEMYGIDLHPVQGESNVEYFLGLTPTGVVVYKHKTKVASYFWPRVTKASHKGKIFTIKVKDKNNEEHIYAFELSTKTACKHLWKCCVEHHSFFSGRSERLAASESKSREQIRVARAPSRRQPRRVNSDSRLNAEQLYRDEYLSAGRGTVTMMGQPEPVRAPRHRSLPELMGRQSPRSVKSAPWQSKHDYGLYTSGHDSPTSGYNERRDRRHPSFVSQGSDSESGISQRKRYFPGRKGSDNESDASTSRRRRREIDSDSGSEVSFTNSGQNRKKRYSQGQKEVKNGEAHMLYPFHDKENVPHGSIPSLHSAPAGEVRQRRRRRRSKSPGNSKRPPEELRQHFEYDLVDTEGMTEEQLRDIPFTKVETKANLFRVKYSPKFRQKIWASRRKSFGDADKNTGRDSHGASLSRQDSWNTDPAGGYSRVGRISGGYSEGHLTAYQDAQPEQEVISPSRHSEHNTSGYNPATASRAYLNPVYLNHQDTQYTSGADRDVRKNGSVGFSPSNHERYPSESYRSDYGSRNQTDLNRQSFTQQNTADHRRPRSRDGISRQGHEEYGSQNRSRQGQLFPETDGHREASVNGTSSSRNSYNSAYNQSPNINAGPRHAGISYHANTNTSSYGTFQRQSPSRYGELSHGSPQRATPTPPRTITRSSFEERSTPPRPGSGSYYKDQGQGHPQVTYPGQSGSSRGYYGSQNRPSDNLSNSLSPQQHNMRNPYNFSSPQFADRQPGNKPYHRDSPQTQGQRRSPPRTQPESVTGHPGYSRPQQPVSSFRSDLVTQL